MGGVVPEVPKIRPPDHEVMVWLYVETVGEVIGVAAVLVDASNGC